MRSRYNIITIVAGLMLVLQACTKGYEDKPLGQQTTLEYVFSSIDSAGKSAKQYQLNLFLQTLYVDPHNRFGTGNYLDAGTDDAMPSQSGLPEAFKLLTGAVNQFSPVDDIWNRSYAAIRSANVFLKYFPIVPLNERLPNGNLAKPAYLAEVRFLRAWTYFELVKRYGGVPLMGDSVLQIDDDVLLPRRNFGDCISYIVSELDAITNDLRTQETISSDTYGRPTKGAAMALKAKVLLYAASPLFNGGNIGGTNALTGYSAYDANRWKLAADAAKAVMNLNVYQLMPNFIDIFLNQAKPVGSNTEYIFWRQNGNSTDIEKSNGPVGYTSAGSTGNTSVSQNLVDAFPMLSGLSITDPASGYNPNNMYDNRDPRLKLTVFYNGALWLNRSVETFAGGQDRPGGTAQQTRTGYYMRKFMGNFESAGGGTYSSHVKDWPYLRYAEVLLNYAEATNEFSGPETSVYQVLYDLRKRAGITAGAGNNYGVKAGMTKDEMRVAIQNERRIELAFEEHRFFDLRRWKIAAAVLAQPLYGQNIQRTSSGQLFYNKVVVLQPVFRAPQMYLYPIQNSEVLKNNNMVQNPFW